MESQIPLEGIIAVPIVAAIVQMLKPFLRDERLWPVVAVAIGLVWNVAASWADNGGATVLDGLVGVVMGLAASGLYSTAKTFNERGTEESREH